MPHTEHLFENVSCNFCGTDTFDEVLASTLTARELSSFSQQAVPAETGIKTARIVRCRQCGLCYANPRPRVDFLTSLYERSCDPHFLEEGPYKVRSASFYLKKLRAHATGNRLLDIGCYTGFFLKGAQEGGWQVQGLEPSEWAANYARQTLRLPVKTGTLNTVSFEPVSFDVITLFQVLEHAADPKHFLKRVHELLVPGGIVVIEVPDIESLAARLLRTKWWLLKPVHLYYFSLNTLLMYVEQAGFQKVWQGRASNIFSLGHLAGRLSPYLGKGATFLQKMMTVVKLDKVGISLNLGDLLLVHARKKP